MPQFRGVFFAKKITPRQHSSAADSASWLAQLRSGDRYDRPEKPPSPVTARGIIRLRRSSMPHSQNLCNHATAWQAYASRARSIGRGLLPNRLPPQHYQPGPGHAAPAAAQGRGRTPPPRLAAGMLCFFRDPEARDHPGPGFISPADGVVQSIMPWEGTDVPAVAIFMEPAQRSTSNRAPALRHG